MRVFDKNDTRLTKQFDNINWISESGVDEAELEALHNDLMKQDLPHAILKAKAFELILKNGKIAVTPEDIFQDKVFGSQKYGGALIKQRDTWECEIREKFLHEKFSRVSEAQRTGAYNAQSDFGHTSPNSKLLLEVGFSGILERIKKHSQKENLTEKQKIFYQSSEIALSAIIDFVKRLASETEKYDTENGAALYNIAKGAPSNIYEAMQLLIVYFFLHENVGAARIRTLGRLDTLLYPFYLKEREGKRKDLLIKFFKEIDKLEAVANIPFTIGGTDENGKTLINDLSFAIVDAYGKAETNNTKFHVLYSEDTPDEIIKRVFEEIRDGNNSIVFMNDRVVISSLIKMGEDKADAVDYHVVGCYECGGNGEVTCSCNGRVNIPKALEVALNGGRDMLTDKLIGLENDGIFPTFESLYNEFKRQLDYFSDCAIKCTDIFERGYKNIHSAPILSATYISALEKGGDLYCDYTAKYNNSSINAIGLGTAVDSLWAIKRAVYDEKRLTLDALTEILKKNWKDNEILRLAIKNKYEKWGNGINEVDELGKRIVDDLSQRISGRPNQKGGQYRLGTFSINWRWEFGEKTAASADGRIAGETLSQNTSATFGADKRGATAHLRSVTKIDATKTPNASIVDIDLHISSVEGENGINALIDSLKGYFALGGFAAHYNVLNTETLKKAYIDPGSYPNLQVRLCGWNVLFSSLSKKEQEEFIRRSERD